MKQALKIIYLFIFFIIFCLYETFQNSGTRVIEIITPSKIVVDLNNNGIKDDGETICIPDIKVFTANLQANQNELAKSLNISQTDAINAGYLSDEFAKETLLGQKVTVEFTENAKPECKFANIKIDEKNYSELLLNSGLGIIDNKPANPELFKQKIKEAQALNLVILNRKSRKFHKLDCKFGLNSADYVIIPMKDAENMYERCKYCLVRPVQQEKFKAKVEETLDKSTYPEVFIHQNIKFIVSDYTNHLVPDSKCAHYFCKEVVNLIYTDFHHNFLRRQSKE